MDGGPRPWTAWEPPAVDDPRVQTAKKLHADKGMAVSAVCQTLKISRPTLCWWLAVKPPVAGARQAEGKAAASV